MKPKTEHQPLSTKDAGEKDILYSQIWLMLNKVKRGEDIEKAHDWLCVEAERFLQQARQEGYERGLEVNKQEIAGLRDENKWMCEDYKKLLSSAGLCEAKKCRASERERCVKQPFSSKKSVDGKERVKIYNLGYDEGSINGRIEERKRCVKAIKEWLGSIGEDDSEFESGVECAIDIIKELK